GRRPRRRGIIATIIRIVTGIGTGMRSDDSVNGSVSFGCASESESESGRNGDATIASSVTGTMIDSGVIHITVAGNSAGTVLFGGFLSYLQKGRVHPALSTIIDN